MVRLIILACIFLNAWNVKIEAACPFSAQLPPAVTTNSTCGTAPASCEITRYRSYDGSCNNLRNGVWGTPQTTFERLLSAIYGDGISSPTVSKRSKPLPLPRVLSLKLFPDIPNEDPVWTLAAMQYGQIIAHDMSFIAGNTVIVPQSTECCTEDGQFLDETPAECFPLVFQPDDPFYSQSNRVCMNFVRTLTDRDQNCSQEDQPAEQISAVNHFLDLSLVYGNTEDVVEQLREFQGGRLITNERSEQQWPPQANNVSATCPLQSANEACYLTGDGRVNQNPQLALLQIVLLREHNRLANALAIVNPHWDDEKLFQEARRIAIAEHQQIVYYEWLPIFIGAEHSLHNGIVYNFTGFVNDYQENVNPTVLNEHTTVAFRHFHTNIAGHLELVKEGRDSFSSLVLSDWFNKPAILEREQNFDELVRGLATQKQMLSDQFFDKEITQFLFRDEQPFGADLRAVDIQRNRDHGLATYNDYRRFCGLPKATKFSGFLDVISKENVNKLAALYKSPDDVDLAVGGVLENNVDGALVGPTFLCIITEQFHRTRVGDRFFFENENPVSGFSLAQLQELRKASISKLLCDNGGNVTSIQLRGFEQISESNNVVPCESVPAVDLTLWKDDGEEAEATTTAFI